ncbi:hsp90 co-chaperone Cdc37 [Ascosphaera acerosa]|nr:hsp90 co-chaperone Cdc37 [Ascosphaera acerosa]
MVLDYSKWDALELSDDSDIEVHPNVDKRSFIRAKQHQIHMEREQRRHEIKTLKYEKGINAGLLARIDVLLARLREGQQRVGGGGSSSNGDGDGGARASPDEVVFKVILAAAADGEDAPPAPPDGVHTEIKEHQKYSQMLSSLADQVKKELQERTGKTGEESDGGGDPFSGYIAGVEGHKKKVEDLQSRLLTRLAELERIEKSKITSDDIHTGFDTTIVAKNTTQTKTKTKGKTKEKEKGKPDTAAVELLNPSASSAPTHADETDESDGDDDGDDQDQPAAPGDADENLKATPLAKRFARLPTTDYAALRNFIMTHRARLLTERKTDELLMEAFDAVIEGDEAYARQCVHQGLLLQYCRSLGPDGIPLFFTRITTPGHRAGTLFRDDVADTFAKIRTRAREIARQSETANADGEVAQIQLHAVDPGTKININVPRAGSTAPEDAPALAAFASFSAEMQAALRSGKLDEVNLVLGRMRVEEAEAVVERLSESGILGVEGGIVDATTEEGKQFLSELEAQRGAEDQQGEEAKEEEQGQAPGQAAAAAEPSAEPSTPRLVDEID